MRKGNFTFTAMDNPTRNSQ